MSPDPQWEERPLRILWLKTELLHPVDKGGRIRTYQMLKAIAAHHHVTYLTLDDGDAADDAAQRAAEYCAEVVRIPFAPPRKGTIGFFLDLLANLASPLPYAIARYRSREMQHAVARLAGAVDVVVCDFLAPAINMPPACGVPTVLFQHNVEAMIWERHAEVARSGLRKRYMAGQSRRMSAFERRACRAFDHVIAVSVLDANTMRERYGVKSIGHVPTGTDVEYFSPADRAPRRASELVFTGSMDWMPNDDAMIWFIDDILPLVRRRHPEVELCVVGRSPGAQLRRRAEAAGGVTITGRVDDVRPFLERASVFIVPIRVGGGTRLKIFEAMAMGLPVIATDVGAEGLPIVDGSHALLRNQPHAFAEAVVAVLEDDALRHRIGSAGQELVHARFGWCSVADEFVHQCRATIQNTAAAGNPDHVPSFERPAS